MKRLDAALVLMNGAIAAAVVWAAVALQDHARRFPVEVLAGLLPQLTAALAAWAPRNRIACGASVVCNGLLVLGGVTLAIAWLFTGSYGGFWDRLLLPVFAALLLATGALNMRRAWPTVSPNRKDEDPP